MKITPRLNNVVISPIEEKSETIGGIKIPRAGDQEVPDQGIIVSAGKGSDLKKGDKVVFNKFSSKEFTIDEKLYYVCPDEDVLAILKK